MSAAIDPRPESAILSIRGPLASLLLVAAPALIVWRVLGRSRPTARARAGAAERQPGAPGTLDPGARDRGSRSGSPRPDARALELVLADRMAVLGTLAAGTSHEINNPLSCITGNLGYALERLPQVGGPEDAAGQVTAAVREALLEAQQGADRVREVVGALKAFTRTGEADVPVDLPRVVTTAIHLSRHATRGRARVVVDAGPLPPVLADEAKLGHLVMNLLLDAAQAIPDDGRGAGRIRVTLAERPPGRLALQVSDTGAGIPPESLPCVFEPFSTAAAPGVRAGLGLALSHRIAAALGGELTVESTVGQGTTCTVLLPAYRGDAPPRRG